MKSIDDADFSEVLAAPTDCLRFAALPDREYNR